MDMKLRLSLFLGFIFAVSSLPLGTSETNNQLILPALGYCCYGAENRGSLIVVDTHQRIQSAAGEKARKSRVINFGRKKKKKKKSKASRFQGLI